MNLTDAQSLGPTTPDLSGIASNLNLSLPETPAIPEDLATPSPLATIDTTLSVGDSVAGYSATDTIGAPLPPSEAAATLDIRRTTGAGPFINSQGDRVTLNDLPYGEPATRIIKGQDGTIEVQVGARIADPGTRDNYTSAAMVLPDTATKEQQKAAIAEVKNAWSQNYAGITSTEQVERGAAKVQPLDVDAVTKKMDSDAAAVVEAEETTETEASAEVVKDAEESQAIIEQVKASEKDSGNTVKTWIPSAEKFDWVQLTSNEWLKGEIKGMYKDSLEFDSDKLDLLDICLLYTSDAADDDYTVLLSGVAGSW